MSDEYKPDDYKSSSNGKQFVLTSELKVLT